MNSPIKTAEPRVFADYLSTFFASISGRWIIMIFIMGGGDRGIKRTGNGGFTLCLSTEMEEG